MKYLISSAMLFALLIGATNAFGAITPPPSAKGEVVLVNSKNVSFSMASLDDVKEFKRITYNSVTKLLELKADENIAFVEIFNDKGVLQYMLPVGAKLLTIDLLDFSKGTYTVNIKIQEVGTRIISSTLVKSF